MIKAIIFDCFGVFIGDMTKARVVELAKTDPSRAEEFRSVARSSDRGVLADEEAVAIQADILGMSAEAFQEIRRNGEVRNEELIAFVRTLKGKFKLAMLSNINSRQRLDIRFLPGQLDELFDPVVPSGEVGFIKPDPGIYKVAAERLGVLPEECIMIDDIEAFCQGARDVGMQAIQFLSTEQCITDLNSLIDRGGKTD